MNAQLERASLDAAVIAYQVIAQDETTRRAAFGVAADQLRESLNLNLRAAVLLLGGELERRGIET